jgi:hypothetical protein
MKYYLYIDECGDNNLKNFDEQFPIFTLCGIVVSEEKLKWLEHKVQVLKDDFWGNQYTILHSRDIRKCQRGFEILFDLDVKKRFYNCVNDILGTADIYIIVACAILKEPYIRNYGRLNDVYAQSLSFVLERTVFYLDSLRYEKASELHTIVEQRGKKEDEKLRMFYNQLLANGTYWASAERLKSYAKSFTLLPKKANVIGLQVADLVAYPITRHLLDPTEPNMAYDVIKDNIYAENEKKLGIKILPCQ